ncbi:Tol-Pal system protein TolB, partial [Frankliniella fusca]
ATCQSSQFTPCQRRGHYPLCVSRELECDGYHNCPLLAEDEDPNMCNRRHRLIGKYPLPLEGQLADPQYGKSNDHCRAAESPGQEKEQKSFPADAKDLLFEFLTNHRRQYSPNGSRPDTSLQTEPSPDTLSNYGPWGYLMLGMLVCGAFLMLCGLWECCCRQPKPTPAAPSHTPTTVLMPQVGVSGGVLVLDSDLDDDPQRPPAYDDLDQPPAYGALFPPGQPKLDDDPAVGAAPAPVLALSLMADAPFPAVDDVASLHSSPSTSSVTSASSLAPS